MPILRPKTNQEKYWNVQSAGMIGSFLKETVGE